MLDLLVHCHDFQSFASGPRFAARLAASLDAQLTGMYVAPRMPRLAPEGTPPSLRSEFLAFVHAEIDRAQQAHAAFGRMVEGHGVHHWHWQLALGELTECIEAAGNWHDLIVLEHRERVPRYCTEMIIAALMTGLPCIVVPESAATATSPPQRIAIAWNGSIEAIRAVHAALPVLKAARQVYVLASPAPPRTRSVTCEPEFSLERYLQLHDCRFKVDTLGSSHRPVEETILLASASLGAEMLVMGAFGIIRPHAGDRRGTTNYVIEHSSMPLFLRH